jgi:Flp pilus assembly protein TadD
VERSRQLIGQGRFQENDDLLWVAASEHPKSAEIAVRLASTMAVRIGKSEVAAEWADRAAALAPDDPRILWLTAEVLFNVGRIEEARVRLKATLDVADESFPHVLDCVHLGGLIAWKRDKLDSAEEMLRVAFEETPETPGFAKDLVRFYEEQDRLEDAARVAQVGLQHSPDDEVLARYAGGES